MSLWVYGLLVFLHFDAFVRNNSFFTDKKDVRIFHKLQISHLVLIKN